MNRLSVLIVVVLAMAGVGVVFAIDDATVRIAQVDGAGFQARDIEARVQITDQGLQVRARVGELSLEGGTQHLKDVRIDCPALQLTAERVTCERADLTASMPVLGQQKLHAAIDYGRVDGSLRMTAQGLRLGSGQARVQLALIGERWTASVALQNAALQPLIELAHALQVQLPAITGDGRATLDVDANGANAAVFTVEQLHVRGELGDLTFNNDTGTLASDKLQLTLDASLQRRKLDWDLVVDVKSHAGQAYFEPVFLDFGAHALSVSAKGRWTNDGVLSLERFAIDHTDVLHVAGAATLALDAEQPVRDLQLELQQLKFPGAYESYLQPYLVNTSFKSMSTSGELAGRITVREGVPQLADVRFEALTFDDGARSFALRELHGDVHWRNADEEQSAAPTTSHVRFAGGTFLGLDLGASELSFATGERTVRLLEPVRIPLFDGAIELESFRARNVGLPSVAFIVDATIQPISVAQLCRAFGWPEFGGQIGGVISKLRLRDGVVTLGTTLEAHVFDGTVKLSDLRLEDALGKWPRFFANVGLDHLDLELVTQAFSFGRITGRVSGAIRELRLFNWTPVGFDLSLYTPPDDRSRHRISQRAVENIGSLGGGGAGVTAALSSGFLRFFEDFNYDRLGLSCRLQNEVCDMNGVAPAPHGSYYLVKGKGVPRIDVIASARRVDWPRLLAQLKAATESSGPSVQ